MIQKETTGMILRKLRGDRTQEEIAAILGITKSSWAMYERDNFENCWKQYHSLGVNGVMDDLHRKFLELSTDPPEE